MLMKMAWVVGPLSERLGCGFLLMIAAGGICRSAWSSFVAASGLCGKVNRWSSWA